MTTTTRITVEIELEVEGTFVPYERERGPTYDCGGTPAVEAGFEDLDITRLRALNGHPLWDHNKLMAAFIENIVHEHRPAITEALLDEHSRNAQ